MMLFIYNPKAGLKTPDELNTLIHALNHSDIKFDLYLTEVDFGPIEILNKVDTLYEGYIIGGGDGTVSQMVQAMYDHQIDKPLVILPIGTANEVAKNLGHIESVPQILESLSTLSHRKVDLGVLNRKQTFTFALTFGNFTEVTYKTPQNLKNWLGYRAYIIYGFLTFRRIHAYGLKIQCDQEKLEGDFVFAGITNSKSVGGIFHYDENEIELSDGLFEVMFIRKPRSVKQIRQILQAMTSSSYDDNDMFLMRQCKEISVESDTEIALNIDGEFGGTTYAFNAMNLHRHLKLVGYTRSKEDDPGINQ